LRSSLDSLCKPVAKFVELSSGLCSTDGAFPDYDYPPSRQHQFRNLLSIASAIRIQFVYPKLTIRSGDLCILAVGVPMPKASVDKNRRAMFG
jgi:hypothetical protein